MEAAFDAIRRELAAGQVVCIFPEGALTKDGEMMRFRRGIERILAESPVPVLPMAVNGLWGSMFSRSGRRSPRGFRSPIQVTVGELTPADVTAEALEVSVRAMWSQGQR